VKKMYSAEGRVVLFRVLRWGRRVSQLIREKKVFPGNVPMTKPDAGYCNHFGFGEGEEEKKSFPREEATPRTS